MRIKEVRTHVLEAELRQPFSWSLGWTRTRSALLVEIEAADGTIGWGESYGPARPNAAVVEAMKPLLIGTDALASEAIWQRLYAACRDHGQKGLAVQALSGVDIALWDLKGKHFGVAAHRLMGGPLCAECGPMPRGCTAARRAIRASIWRRRRPATWRRASPR